MVRRLRYIGTDFLLKEFSSVCTKTSFRWNFYRMNKSGFYTIPERNSLISNTLNSETIYSCLRTLLLHMNLILVLANNQNAIQIHFRRLKFTILFSQYRHRHYRNGLAVSKHETAYNQFRAYCVIFHIHYIIT